MAVIKSGNSTDQLTIDSTSKAARTTLYNSGGAEITAFPISGTVSVNNFPATQPVSGTVTANAGTGTMLVDGSAHTQPVSGSVAISNFPATQPISAISLPLPSGAATSANQTAANNSLSSIDGKLTTAVNGLKVDGSASTQPVSGFVSISNFPATYSISNFPATQPISGTVTANAGTGTMLVDGSAHTQPISGTIAVSNFPATQPISGSVTANQGGVWTVQPGNTANTTAWKVDGSAVTQPISGSISISNFPATQPISAVSLPLPSGAATSANQSTGNSSLSSIDGKLTTTANGLKVDGSAVTQPISGAVSISNFPATQPISGTVTANAGTGTMLIDGSAHTQPVSGTVTSNIGTTNGLALDATISTAQPRKLQGSVSGAQQDVGTTSKGAYTEHVDSSGKLGGAAKNIFTLTAINFTGATTEAMITLTPSTDGVNGSTGTSFTVPANKRFVVLGMSVVTKNAAAAVQGIICRLRYSSTGAVTTASSVLALTGAGTSLATANVVGDGSLDLSGSFPSTLELSGTMQVGVSQIGTATAGNDVVVWGYLY